MYRIRIALTSLNLEGCHSCHLVRRTPLPLRSIAGVASCPSTLPRKLVSLYPTSVGRATNGRNDNNVAKYVRNTFATLAWCWPGNDLTQKNNSNKTVTHDEKADGLSLQFDRKSKKPYSAIELSQVHVVFGSRVTFFVYLSFLRAVWRQQVSSWVFDPIELVSIRFTNRQLSFLFQVGKFKLYHWVKFL